MSEWVQCQLFSKVVWLSGGISSHTDPQPFSPPGLGPSCERSPAPAAPCPLHGARRTKATPGTRHNNSPACLSSRPGRAPRSPPSPSVRNQRGLGLDWQRRGRPLRGNVAHACARPCRKALPSPPPSDRGWSRPGGRSGRARGAGGTKKRSGRGCAAGVAGCRRRGGRCGRAASGAG